MMNFSHKIKGDKIIWAVVIFLCLCSILAIYSSVAPKESFLKPLFKQSGLVLFSLLAIYVTHRIPIGWYRRLAIPILVFSVVLLILTPFIGETARGATRAISISGFTIHSADFAKIGLILYMAKIMESEALSTFKEFAWKILAPAAVVFVLVLLSSTSAALLFLFMVVIVLFIGEIKKAFLLRTLLFGAIFMGLYFADGATVKILPRSETALSRVKSFFNAEEENITDKHKKDDQLDYSKMAIATGGVTGKGPGHSTQRYILSQAYSDFIYAIIIEEYGLVGGTVILLSYLILLFRAVVIARSCTRVFPMLVVLGFVLSIVCQAMLNMCVAVGLTPVTGQPLPLVSLGGSSLVTLSISLGIVLAVSRATDERKIIEKKESE